MFSGSPDERISGKIARKCIKIAFSLIHYIQICIFEHIGFHWGGRLSIGNTKYFSFHLPFFSCKQKQSTWQKILLPLHRFVFSQYHQTSMSLHNSHFKDKQLRICVIDVIFIVFQHIFVNHFPLSLKINSATYIISLLLKRPHITVCAHHCSFSCDLRQLSQCRVQVHRVLLTLTVCNF